MEAGVPGYEAATGSASSRPAGTPQPIIERLHKEIAAIQDSPEVQKQFAAEGAASRNGPRRVPQYMVSEMNKWEHVVKTGRHQGAVSSTAPRCGTN